MTDAEIAKLPPYKKLVEITRDLGGCFPFLTRADRCTSYQEAMEKEGSNLIKWFAWLQNFFTVPARAEYEKVMGPAWAEYKKVMGQAWAEYKKVVGPAWAEYEKVMDVALIQGVIDSFGEE
jgi:hypothetical protein